jgi:signal transduction histidine kinase
VTGGPTPINGDAELLKIVFQNLLINAAQATNGKGRVAIAVERAGGFVETRVSDNGPGILPDVREKLFQPFYTTKARGTGLGLSTARRLIEAHGGTIAVDCPASGGTLVTIRLPA